MAELPRIQRVEPTSIPTSSLGRVYGSSDRPPFKRQHPKERPHDVLELHETAEESPQEAVDPAEEPKDGLDLAV